LSVGLGGGVVVVAAMATGACDARRGRHDALDPCSEARVIADRAGPRSPGDAGNDAAGADPTGAASGSGAAASLGAGSTGVATLSGDDAGRAGWPAAGRRDRASAPAIADDDGGASSRW